MQNKRITTGSLVLFVEYHLGAEVVQFTFLCLCLFVWIFWHWFTIICTCGITTLVCWSWIMSCPCVLVLFPFIKKVLWSSCASAIWKTTDLVLWRLDHWYSIVCRIRSEKAMFNRRDLMETLKTSWIFLILSDQCNMNFTRRWLIVGCMMWWRWMRPWLTIEITIWE